MGFWVRSVCMSVCLSVCLYVCLSVCFFSIPLLTAGPDEKEDQTYWDCILIWLVVNQKPMLLDGALVSVLLCLTIGTGYTSVSLYPAFLGFVSKRF